MKCKKIAESPLFIFSRSRLCVHIPCSIKITAQTKWPAIKRMNQLCQQLILIICRSTNHWTPKPCLFLQGWATLELSFEAALASLCGSKHIISGLRLQSEISPNAAAIRLLICVQSDMLDQNWACRKCSLTENTAVQLLTSVTSHVNLQMF